MAAPLVVDVLRGSHPESRHLVDVAVVDSAGSVVESWGEPQRLVLPRSALKPVQSSALILSEAADGLELSGSRLAIACASHGGEPEHVAAVTDWLDDLGLDTESLECGAHAPMNAASASALASAGVDFDARHNNCSGKHCGYLAICCHVGLEIEGYIGPDHLLQREHITPAIEQWCGVVLAGESPGIDGCGVPVWAMPLDALARGWAALAADPVGRRIFAAMTRDPWLVAGTGRTDTRLMSTGDGRVVVKTGAEGVFCGLDVEQGFAVGLKVHDGATRASEVAIEWVLARLGELAEPDPRVLRNWAGAAVGVVQVAR